MKARTLNALRGSIHHWEQNATAKRYREVSIEREACALCGLFNNSEGLGKLSDCVGCPVKAKTGKPYCFDTPFRPALEAYNKNVPLKKFRELAAAELYFLESLLPQEDKR